MGKSVPDLCREHGMSSACFYQWRSKYGGMDASLMKRMKELEEENRRLSVCRIFFIENSFI
jgi:putative transposase